VGIIERYIKVKNQREQRNGGREEEAIGAMETMGSMEWGKRRRRWIPRSSRRMTVFWAG